MAGQARTAVAAVAALAVVVALLLLGWIGGELHYRNCLANVELRYPVAYQQAAPNPRNPYAEQFGLGGGVEAGFAFHDRADRNDAIAACSRWP
ncbi:MAG TPA: hypothetical protein VNM89_09685 [Solirubrobacterales bacterium]|nr:hypothetical protein [Solirubrobacterales bacterium]